MHERELGRVAATQITRFGAAMTGTLATRLPTISAARRAFSLTFSITQCDAASRRSPVLAGGSVGGAQTVKIQSGRDD
jgi:hypothetical protein